MIKQHHPTLKKCHCGFVGTRTQLYKHFDTTRFADEQPVKDWFDHHGEVPLNTDDPLLVNLNKSNTL